MEQYIALKIKYFKMKKSIDLPEQPKRLFSWRLYVPSMHRLHPLSVTPGLQIHCPVLVSHSPMLPTTPGMLHWHSYKYNIHYKKILLYNNLELISHITISFIFTKCNYYRYNNDFMEVTIFETNSNLRNRLNCKAADSNKVACIDCIFFLRLAPCTGKVHRAVRSRNLGKSQLCQPDRSCNPRR